MPKTKTSITSDRRKNMPSRGKSKRTLILDAIRSVPQSGFVDNPGKSDVENREVAEQAFFSKLAQKAMDAEDKDSGLCIRLLMERGWAALKPSSDCVKFKFDKDASPTLQASQVMDAVAEGIIPPDLGIAFVGGIRSIIDIEANVELKARIEKLEAMIDGV